MSLFDKYGFESISKVVNEFYDLIEATPALDKYFRDVDMMTLRDHQTDFISQVLGGPIKYDENHLKEMHKGLNISNKDFDLVGALLLQALHKVGVEGDDVSTIMNYIESIRADIVEQ